MPKTPGYDNYQNVLRRVKEKRRRREEPHAADMEYLRSTQEGVDAYNKWVSYYNLTITNPAYAISAITLQKTSQPTTPQLMPQPVLQPTPQRTLQSMFQPTSQPAAPSQPVATPLMRVKGLETYSSLTEEDEQLPEVKIDPKWILIGFLAKDPEPQRLVFATITDGGYLETMVREVCVGKVLMPDDRTYPAHPSESMAQTSTTLRQNVTLRKEVKVKDIDGTIRYVYDEMRKMGQGDHWLWYDFEDMRRHPLLHQDQATLLQSLKNEYFVPPPTARVINLYAMVNWAVLETRAFHDDVNGLLENLREKTSAAAAGEGPPQDIIEYHKQFLIEYGNRLTRLLADLVQQRTVDYESFRPVIKWEQEQLEAMGLQTDQNGLLRTDS